MTEKQKDKSIYSVFSGDRLFEIFKTSQLTLVRPKLWDDPFENVIMNSTGELESGEMFTIDFRDNFYGQCWTYTNESDAIWRIYAPDKDGVRVRTTPRKLLKSLYEQSEEFRDIHCFIGKVDYYNKNSLNALLSNSKIISSWLLDSTGAGQAKTLLFKRNAFKHENEVRILFNSNKKVKGDLFKYSIAPLDLIEDIVFDPRMEYKKFKNYKSDLKKQGFKGRIVKSNLYKVPKINFKLVK